MSFEIKGTRNYSATVIRVPKVRKAQNSDNLYIVDALGMTAIVDKSWIEREGELALLFPAEVRLSQEFAAANGLYKQSLELNTNREASGYIEKSSRVKALKLRGNISNGLVLPLTSLSAIGVGDNYLSEGDVFDTIVGKEICRKYVVESKSGGLSKADAQKKAFKRVTDVFLPAHFDTGQWLREEHNVHPDEELIITQKLHGTSCRLANTVVKRELTLREKFAQKFLGAKIAVHEYDLVAGSRKVIKDPNNPNQKHHYGSDIWSDALAIWGDRIPTGHIVYGELVGYIPGSESPIQKGHTYEEFAGNYELYVYRVAIITEGADLIDMTWDQVRSFCERHGLKHTPELDRIPKALLDIEDYNELDFWAEHQEHKKHGIELYVDTPVKLSAGGTGKDEGIAIRIDRGAGLEIFKYKNPSHYLYETAQLDSGEEDLESQG